MFLKPFSFDDEGHKRKLSLKLHFRVFFFQIVSLQSLQTWWSLLPAGQFPLCRPPPRTRSAASWYRNPQEPVWTLPIAGRRPEPSARTPPAWPCPFHRPTAGSRRAQMKGRTRSSLKLHSKSLLLTGLTSSKIEDFAMRAGFLAFFSAYSFSLCSLSLSASSSSSLPNRSMSSSSSSSLTGQLFFCCTAEPCRKWDYTLAKNYFFVFERQSSGRRPAKTNLHLCRSATAPQSRMQEVFPERQLDTPAWRAPPAGHPPLRGQEQSQSRHRYRQR